MVKFLIEVAEHQVVAYQDSNDADLLWYDDAYGIECVAYLSEHPEASRIQPFRCEYKTHSLQVISQNKKY